MLTFHHKNTSEVSCEESKNTFQHPNALSFFRVLKKRPANLVIFCAAYLGSV